MHSPRYALRNENGSMKASLGKLAWYLAPRVPQDLLSKPVHLAFSTFDIE